MNATTQSDLKLETQSCTRCGGSGHYSYCQSHGTTCFKCGGNRIIFSKRGSMANAFLTAIRSKPIDQVKVGDKVKVEFGSPIGRQVLAFGTVTKSQRATSFCQSGVGDNARKTFYWELDVQHPKYGGFGQFGFASTDTNKPTMMRVAQSATDKWSTFHRAMAYQAKLNKLGKPAKGAVFTAEELAFRNAI